MLQLAPALARLAGRLPGWETLVNVHWQRGERRYGQPLDERNNHRAEDIPKSGLSSKGTEGEEPADAVPYPPEFDPDVYRCYADLAEMNNDKLWLHYREYGLAEGRMASAACRREDFLALAASAKAVLEIGPFCSPAIRKEGVKYFDVMDQEGLRERAKGHQLDPDGCPYIDYVSPVGDLSVVAETFDVIISSHAVEHQPDLIKHLQQVKKLLRPSGAYFLIVPDKRFCFDHFIPETALANVVAAHHEERELHSLQSVVEHLALTTHNDALRHWSGDHGDRLTTKTRERIDAGVRHYCENAGSYIDIHAWQFTPASFRSLIHDLHDLNYIELFPTRVYDTPRDCLEFAAILSRRDNMA